MATRKCKYMYVAHLIFLLDNAVSGKIFTRDVHGILSILNFDMTVYCEIVRLDMELKSWNF